MGPVQRCVKSRNGELVLSELHVATAEQAAGSTKFCVGQKERQCITSAHSHARTGNAHLVFDGKLRFEGSCNVEVNRK